MTITTTNPVVGIAGDWHGDLGWALSMVSRFHKHKIDTILHLGDFGIWRCLHGDKYLRENPFQARRIWNGYQRHPRKP